MVANNALKKRIFVLLVNSSPSTLQVIVTHWHIKPYSTMGDELTSSVKILFFEVNSTLPLLQVPSNSYVIPL